MPGRVRKRFIISGIVQGVGFRYYALKTALRFNIVGKVANASDESVIVEAEGMPEQVEEFSAFLRKGPLCSFVENVEEKDIEVTGENGFRIVSYMDM